MKSKKEQILDMSFSLFLEKGYDNTSISDILSKLDIARGTLYYHFESKEAIMDAIIERTAKKIVEEAKGIVFGTRKDFFIVLRVQYEASFRRRAYD